ncbi:hypothetical protein AB0L88_15145 [Saccharopolyspora shandongensis]|uniref:hypothetical protein n=1 Tax=Saccharopolyspora shandongensis TaxID=418495 RepID=UPI003428F945
MGVGPLERRSADHRPARDLSVGAVGLGGADAALDRTAALRWPPLRAGHVVALAAGDFARNCSR